MASSTEPTNSNESRFESFIEERIAQTAQQVRWVDFFSFSLILTIGLLSALFTLCIIDAWIFELQTWMRWTAFVLMIAASISFLVIAMFPFLFRRINPLYAAQKIEEGRPELKNSVINYLTTRTDQNRRAEVVVREKLSQTAAAHVSNIPLDVTVDRSSMIVAGYILAGLVTLFAIYKFASPKDPFQTIGRVILPASELMAPARVKISQIEPKDAQVYFGETLQISAKIRGLSAGQFAMLLITTEDGRRVDFGLPMTSDLNDENFKVVVGNETGGLQQSFTYRIQAGDATTLNYSVDVRTCPTIFVESLTYASPKYTEIPIRTVETPNEISGVEGAVVTIRAQSNLPIEKAYLELFHELPSVDKNTDPDSKSGEDTESKIKFVKKLLLESVDETAAVGELTLLMNNQRTRSQYTHFRVSFSTPEGDKSQDMAISKISVINDLSPEIEIRLPKELEKEIPLDQTEKIEVSAVDPDYRLTKIEIIADSKGTRLFNRPLLDSRVSKSDEVAGVSGQHLVEFDFAPKAYGLKVGDEVIWHATAEDNRSVGKGAILDPNRTRTENFRFKIIAPLNTPDPSDTEQKSGEQKSGEQKSGEQKSGEQKSGEQKSGEQKSGEQKSGEQKSGEQKSGEQKSGEQKSGEQKSGEQKSGEQKSGEQKSGEQKSGEQKSGEKRPDDQRGRSQEGDSNQKNSSEQKSSRQSSGKESDADRKSDDRSQDGNRGGKGRPDDIAPRDDSQLNEDSAGANGNENSFEQQRKGKPKNSKEAFERMKDYFDKKKEENDKKNHSDSPAEASEKEKQNAGENPTSENENQTKGGEPSQKGKRPEPNSESKDDQKNKSNEGGGNEKKKSPDQEPDPKNGAGDDKRDDGKNQAKKKQGSNDSKSGNKSTNTPKQNSDSKNQKSGSSSGKSKQDDEKSGKSKEPGKKSAAENEKSNEKTSGKDDAGKEETGKRKSNDAKNGDANDQGSKSGESSKQDSVEKNSDEGKGVTKNNTGENNSKSKTSKTGESKSDSKPSDSTKKASEDKSNSKKSESGGDSGDVNSSESNQDSDSNQKRNQTEQSRTNRRNDPQAEKENLKYAKETTDLVLEKLKDQKQNPDKDLLKDLNWTKEELQEFTKRWEQMQKKASNGSERDKKAFQNALKSLGLEDPSNALEKQELQNDDKSGYKESSAGRSVPSEFQNQFRAIQKSKRKLKNSGSK